jgi:hypothetical protein
MAAPGYDYTKSLLNAGNGPIMAMSGGGDGVPPTATYNAGASLIQNVPGTIPAYKGGFLEGEGIVLSGGVGNPGVKSTLGQERVETAIKKRSELDTSPIIDSSVTTDVSGSIAPVAPVAAVTSLNSSPSDSVVEIISQPSNSIPNNVRKETDGIKTKDIVLFGESITLDNPEKDGEPFTESHIKALKAFGLDGPGANDTQKRDVLKALYEGKCNTSQPLIMLEQCEPIRRIVQSLALNLLSKLGTNGKPSLNIIKEEEPEVKYEKLGDGSMKLSILFKPGQLGLLSKFKPDVEKKVVKKNTKVNKIVEQSNKPGEQNEKNKEINDNNQETENLSNLPNTVENISLEQYSNKPDKQVEENKGNNEEASHLPNTVENISLEQYSNKPDEQNEKNKEIKEIEQETENLSNLPNTVENISLEQYSNKPDKQVEENKGNNEEATNLPNTVENISLEQYSNKPYEKVEEIDKLLKEIENFKVNNTPNDNNIINNIQTYINTTQNKSLSSNESKRINKELEEFHKFLNSLSPTRNISKEKVQELKEEVQKLEDYINTKTLKPASPLIPNEQEEFMTQLNLPKPSGNVLEEIKIKKEENATKKLQNEARKQKNQKKNNKLMNTMIKKRQNETKKELEGVKNTMKFLGNRETARKSFLNPANKNKNTMNKMIKKRQNETRKELENIKQYKKVSGEEEKKSFLNSTKGGKRKTFKKAQLKRKRISMKKHKK